MDKDRILAILREHEPELKAAGLLHLRLFGSVARGENTMKSDIDLMADFDRSKPLTLMTLSSLKCQLDHLLGVDTDITSPEWMYPEILTHANSEAVLVF